MKRRSEVILSIYESHNNGVIDEETRDALLEACEDEEDCEESEEESENEEDEIVEYKKKIEELKEKIKKAESKKAIEKIKEKAKDSMEELADVADDDDIEDRLEELYDEFIDSVDEEEENTIEERVNEVRLSIYESCKAGYITESERDELLTIVNEGLYDTIKKAAETGKKVFNSDSLKGLSPSYTDDSLSTGIQMMKQGKLEQTEKEKRASELRKRVALATANAGVGK